MAIHQGRTALYRLFNGAGGLLYVGIATNPDVRWGQHSQDKPWWPEVADRQVEWHDTRTDAAKAEYEAIHADAPLYNEVIPYISVHADPAEREAVPADLRGEQIVGLTEIGEALGVSRQRAFTLAKRRDFPAHFSKTAAGRRWTLSSVMAWERTWDRSNHGGRPRA